MFSKPYSCRFLYEYLKKMLIKLLILKWDRKKDEWLIYPSHILKKND